jgi:hypothetical protein
MEDRRKNKRMQLSSKLIMKRIDGSEIGETAISVTDVSKTGVGFDCGEILTIGAVYESFLTIWTSEVLHAFLEIVRIEKNGEYIFIRGDFCGYAGDGCQQDRSL